MLQQLRHHEQQFGGRNQMIATDYAYSCSTRHWMHGSSYSAAATAAAAAHHAHLSVAAVQTSK
jgi:hypothetical protein